MLKSELKSDLNKKNLKVCMEMNNKIINLL